MQCQWHKKKEVVFLHTDFMKALYNYIHNYICHNCLGKCNHLKLNSVTFFRLVKLFFREHEFSCQWTKLKSTLNILQQFLTTFMSYYIVTQNNTRCKSAKFMGKILRANVIYYPFLIYYNSYTDFYLVYACQLFKVFQMPFCNSSHIC